MPPLITRTRLRKAAVRDYNNEKAADIYLVHASHTCGASHLHLSPCTVLKKGFAGSCAFAESSGQFADLFPMIQHANRTTGFFKIRGVNVNHAEFEDFVFGVEPVNDFQAVLVTDDDDLETLTVKIEVRRGENGDRIADHLSDRIKTTFEISSRVEVLEIGTLARQFESSIKAPRFVDERA